MNKYIEIRFEKLEREVEKLVRSHADIAHRTFLILCKEGHEHDKIKGSYDSPVPKTFLYGGYTATFKGRTKQPRLWYDVAGHRYDPDIIYHCTIPCSHKVEVDS